MVRGAIRATFDAVGATADEIQRSINEN